MSVQWYSISSDFTDGTQVAPFISNSYFSVNTATNVVTGWYNEDNYSINQIATVGYADTAGTPPPGDPPLPTIVSDNVFSGGQFSTNGIVVKNLPIGSIGTNIYFFFVYDFTYIIPNPPGPDVPFFPPNTLDLLFVESEAPNVGVYGPLAPIWLTNTVITAVSGLPPIVETRGCLKPKGMTYTEYLRSKKATDVKIINTKPVRTASEITNIKRLSASSILALNNARTKGSILKPIDFSQGPDHAAQAYFKGGGNNEYATRKVTDASDFTAYLGGQAIGKEIQAGLPPTTITQLPTFNLTSPPVYQSASDYVRQVEACHQALGQPHNADTVTPPVFVDNTVRNLGDPSLCTGRSLNNEACESSRPRAIHSIKAKNAFAHVPNRPSQAGGQYALFGYRDPGKELGAYGGNNIPVHLKINKPITTLCAPIGVNPHYKVGAALDNIPYVEGHHGNDLNVNPIRVPTPFVNVAHQPDQKKINKPVGTFKVV
jgi:hypothetical protein